MDLREIIEQAHMAGQHDAGVDAGYSNARAYCDGILEELAANGAKPTLCDVLESWRKDNGIYEHGPAYKDLCKRLGEYFA